VIDLHTHSTASDGELAPAGVVRHAADCGIETIALTDHDTLDGVEEATSAGAVLGIRVVSGCEFSVAAPWGEMHMLGYFLPTENEELAEFLEGQRDMRLARARKIVDRLRRLGQNVTLDDVLAESIHGAVGRPHVARALTRRGGVGSVNEAFLKYLRSGRPAFVPKNLPSVEEVTGIIRRLGGVSSAAHLASRASSSALLDLRGRGLDAVEARHPSHDEVTTRRIEKWADAAGLLKTGGTDWHGPTEEPDRAPLGGIVVPEQWLQDVESLHRERTSTTEESR
jgi:predicted metal-dependent phosphoesterase TrpH